MIGSCHELELGLCGRLVLMQPSKLPSVVAGNKYFCEQLTDTRIKLPGLSRNSNGNFIVIVWRRRGRRTYNNIFFINTVKFDFGLGQRIPLIPMSLKQCRVGTLIRSLIIMFGIMQKKWIVIGIKLYHTKHFILPLWLGQLNYIPKLSTLTPHGNPPIDRPAHHVVIVIRWI